MGFPLGEASLLGDANVVLSSISHVFADSLPQRGSSWRWSVGSRRIKSFASRDVFAIQICNSSDQDAPGDATSVLGPDWRRELIRRGWLRRVVLEILARRGRLHEQARLATAAARGPVRLAT